MIVVNCPLSCKARYKNPFLTLGRNLFPATGYLYLVWETLAYIAGLLIEEVPIIFENCKFKRACTMPVDNIKLELIVMIQRGSGNFEIIESKQ